MSDGPEVADAREAPDPHPATNGHEPKSPPEPLRLGNLDRRILAVVDPVQPGPDVRMQCVGLVREAQRQAAALPAPHPQGGTETLRALSEAATEGEWISRFAVDAHQCEVWSPAEASHVAITGTDEDAAFIAAAVNYVRALLAAAPAPTEGESVDEA